MPDLTIFGQRLKKLRQELGLSQRDFAARIGVTASALSSYEKGTMNPSLAVAVNAASEFGESLDWLCGLAENDCREKQTTEIETALQYFLSFSDVGLITPRILSDDDLSEWIADAELADPLNKLLLAHCQIKQLLKHNMIDKDTFDKINSGTISNCAASITPMLSETKPDTEYQSDTEEENK